MPASRIARSAGVAKHGQTVSSLVLLQHSSPRSSRHLQLHAASRPRTLSTRTATDIICSSDDIPETKIYRRQHRQRRFPKFLADSPNATLALRLKSRNGPLTFEAWERFDNVARSRSLRLPVVALQMMIRQDEAHRHTGLSESLCDDAQWRLRLSSLAFKGISEADIQHWLWILAGKNGDERIERFVSVDRPKPIFVLFQLLRRDETFQKATSLSSVYSYIMRHHVRSKVTPPDSALPFGAVRRTLDAGLNMTPKSFCDLLRLLLHHYLRLWPTALPAVARLTSAYVEVIQQTSKTTQAAFADSCTIFNKALVLFQRKSPINPVFNMRYNWSAQKILLAMSTTMPRPLLINREAFRAIRRVMLALGKSPAERRVALRAARTWPPFRRDGDGLDEKKQPQDDFSRSVKAGVLMHEAGYPETEHDKALSVLGGVLPGVSPTVQTRSLSPRTWTGVQANLNVYSTWASRVKATRDVNEAWNEFQTPPQPGLRHSVQVYAEMFKKLVAAPVDQLVSPTSKPVLPGDSREVFPVNDSTLTPFEKQRLKPPTVAALYTQMLHENIRPVGDCLALLVQNAPTMEAGLKYLYDSPISNKAIATLKLPHLTPPASLITRHPPRKKPPPPTFDLLRQIPLPILTAYINLMCQFQPRMTIEPARLGKQQRIGLIHHAINLCVCRLPPTTEEGQTYKAPWHSIMRTFAMPKVLVKAEHTQDRKFHDIESLSLALRVFDQVKKVAGVDVVIFESLARTMQKCLRWAGWTVTPTTADEDYMRSIESINGHVTLKSRDTDLDVLLRTAQATLVSAFQEMALLPTVTSILDNLQHGVNADHHPGTPHNITASTMQNYLQTLGYLGDTPAMIQAMQWTLRMWDDDTVLEDAKDMDHGQHSTMGRVLVMFRAFIETQTDPIVLANFERNLRQLAVTSHCTWRWPTSADSDAFVQWHRQDITAPFWRIVRPGV